ncbi:MAG: hypothetical protein CLLPBCKN_003667 [Chroococcidiopsis cubana SAG 39.79]|uniref:Uncharacterized protein n=1 Tax=Chroococcidiopsis thermalis (strain PCC 7203) TaxID=251229 RepID=K9TY91_CHRTP|nr:hypothetical protein Chro_1449 [Chroococcidiopsis thermalis PCC 7203]MDZ4874271.1 hypothetical protein [Chroococcidiopsis cubana SAG 39.79]
MTNPYTVFLSFLYSFQTLKSTYLVISATKIEQRRLMQIT